MVRRMQTRFHQRFTYITVVEVSSSLEHLQGGGGAVIKLVPVPQQLLVSEWQSAMVMS